MTEKSFVVLASVCAISFILCGIVTVGYFQKDFEVIEQKKLVSAAEQKNSNLEHTNFNLTTTISQTQNKLTESIKNSSSLIVELNKNKNQVNTLESEIVELKNEIDQLQDNYDLAFSDGETKGYKNGKQDGYNTGKSDGYDLGYDAGVSFMTENGFNIRDPTYSEAKTFISSDKTNLNTYTLNYNCHDFTSDFKNNAFNVGYRCGYVYVELKDSAHAIIFFNTIDRGLIFVEPQDDTIITLVIGQHYWDRNLYTVYYDDTIIRYDIIW